MPHQCTDCGRQFEDGSKEMLSGCPNCGGNKFQFLPSSASPDKQPEPVSDPQPAGSDRSVARTVGNAASVVRDLVGSSSDPPQVGAPTASESVDEPAETVGQPSESTAQSNSATQSKAVTESKPMAHQESTQPKINRGSDSAVSEPTSTARSAEQSRPDRQSESATATMAERENKAQASARSELVSPDELPSRPEQTQWPDGRHSTDRHTEPTEQSETADQTERPDLSELRAELNQQFESIKVLEPGQYELNLMELFDREEYIVALQEDGKYTVQVPEHWQD